MRGESVLSTIIVTAVTLTGLSLFAVPVVDEIATGQGSGLLGNAAASAAMTYVLLTPMLLAVTSCLSSRLIAVGVGMAAGSATRLWVGLVEAERLGLALALSVAIVAAIVALLLAVRLVIRRRRARVAAMAWVLARSTAQVTEVLRRRASAAPQNHTADGPLPQTLLVETLVYNVLAQGESAETPEAFAQVVVTGLAELRDGLSGNTAADPHGYGALAAGEYCARLMSDLRRMVPMTPPLPSLAVHRLA